MKTPIEDIDWKELQSQKLTLLYLMEVINVETQLQDLQGVINLIDSLQDYAVDVLGKDESEVFNLEEDD